MKHEFSNTAPILRLVFAVAALSVTLSIGGWIDFLATGDLFTESKTYNAE
jgi:hypothetical protein